MTIYKIYNRWDISNIEVKDPGLKRYINLSNIMVPRTGGKNVRVNVWKSKNNIIERFMNKLMVPGHRGKKHKLTSGHNTGKGVKVYNIVVETFNIIEKKM